MFCYIIVLKFSHPYPQKKIKRIYNIYNQADCGVGGSGILVESSTAFKKTSG